MNRTTALTIAAYVTLLAIAILAVGISILNSLNASAEQERFDRSWDNCSLLFEEYDDVVDCHLRNVSD